MEELINKIIAILDQSDIVWSRYGSDTPRELAIRILNSVYLGQNEQD